MDIYLIKIGGILTNVWIFIPESTCLHFHICHFPCLYLHAETTRKVYQKKLERLLKEGPARPVSANGPTQYEDEEEEDEEENLNDTEKFSDEDEEDTG